MLEGVLTVLLGEDVKIIELLESESNQQTIDDKFNRVDIKARNSKDEIIIVEIQNTRELYYLERILYGVAKAITEHISLSECYYEVKKIYSISILYFDIGKGDDYLYHGQNNFTGVHTGDRLEITTKEKDALVRKLPAEVFPEYFLIRVNEFNKVAVTPLEEWIEYLKKFRDCKKSLFYMILFRPISFLFGRKWDEMFVYVPFSILYSSSWTYILQ